ncbi:MAG: putative amidohydrolase YtcJ [Pseudohongiellaceae bacterium]
MKIITLFFCVALTGCGPSPEQAMKPSPAIDPVDIIFVGQNIITMDQSNVTGVAVKGDRISFVGSAQDAMAFKGVDTRVIELGEQALLPGFIDAHGHFSAFASRLDALDLSSPPVGNIKSIDDIVSEIRSWIEVRQIPAGEIIHGVGYDDSLLTELRHPTREDLDRASTQHPIVIRHVSGHLLAANSLALSNANVSALTANPEGGVIRRLDGSGDPDGVMEETAMRLFPSQSSDLNDEQRRLLRRQALKVYASYGITTIQDSNIGQDYLNQLVEEAKVDPFPQDIVAYLWANVMSDDQLAAVTPTEYEGGIRLGGVKFTLDGSPQGRTAWLTEPYTQGPPSALPDYVAYPSYAPELYIQRMPDLIARGVPVLAHANGDAAIDLMLDGIEGGLNLGEDVDHRSVVIHSQLMRPDHLPRFKELGVIASYYSVHPFFWGDWHRLSFGEERASFISPVAATAALDIPLTIHNDTPVVPPDMMRLVSITVNRLTRSGYVLGPDQRASVEQALKAITLGAAYQYFEEAEKGSITLGKRADFVLLESNPLSSEPEQLHDIAIVETFARGKSIYQR